MGDWTSKEAAATQVQRCSMFHHLQYPCLVAYRWCANFGSILIGLKIGRTRQKWYKLALYYYYYYYYGWCFIAFKPSLQGEEEWENLDVTVTLPGGAWCGPHAETERWLICTYVRTNLSTHESNLRERILGAPTNTDVNLSSARPVSAQNPISDGPQHYRST